MREVGRLLAARVVVLLLTTTASCASPEARRERDGGPGSDVGNKPSARAPKADPQAADTTLWPGRALAPVERLARGEIPLPAGVSPAAAPQSRGQTPVTPNVPASKAEQSVFDKGTSANPRVPARPPAPQP